MNTGMLYNLKPLAMYVDLTYTWYQQKSAVLNSANIRSTRKLKDDQGRKRRHMSKVQKMFMAFTLCKEYPLEFIKTTPTITIDNSCIPIGF